MTTKLQRAAEALLRDESTRDRGFGGGLCNHLQRLHNQSLEVALRTAIRAALVGNAFLPAVWAADDDTYWFTAHERYEFRSDVRYLWRLSWLTHLAEGGAP